jgi:copper chaperone CopZ
MLKLDRLSTYIAAIGVAAICGMGCARSAAAGSTAQAKMNVQGLMCRLCLPKVEAALGTVPGFRKMDSQDLSHITVSYDARETKPSDLVAAINKKTTFHAGLAKD